VVLIVSPARLVSSVAKKLLYSSLVTRSDRNDKLDALVVCKAPVDSLPTLNYP